jgi:hypothetical protein
MTVITTPNVMREVAIMFCRVSVSPWNWGARIIFHTKVSAANGANKLIGAKPKAKKSRILPALIRHIPISQVWKERKKERKKEREKNDSKKKKKI